MIGKVDKKVILVLICVMFLLSVGFTATAQVNESVDITLHVNNGHPQASDNNPGTSNSPYKTINAASDKAFDYDIQGLSTKIIVHPGTYRESVVLRSSIQRTNTTLILEAAQPGTAIISGSDVWTDWQSSSNNIYTHRWDYNWGYVASPWSSGDIYVDPVVRRREAIFSNGQHLQQVFSLNEVTNGTFYVDEGANKIYVKLVNNANPNSTLMEVAVRDRVFDVYGTYNLVIRGMTMQHANNAIDTAGIVISDVKNALVENNTIQYNNWTGLGLFTSEDVDLHNNVSNYNGGAGMTLWKLHRINVRHNETSYNNLRGRLGGFDDWSVAGIKSMRMRDSVYSEHLAVGNYARGIWFDYDNKNITVTDSIACENHHDGIFLEVSPGPIEIRDSVICDNEQAGVFIGNSENIKLESNMLYGNDIGQVTTSKSVSRGVVDTYNGTSSTLFNQRLTMNNNMLMANGNEELSNFTYYTWFFNTFTANGNTWFHADRSDGIKVPWNNPEFMTLSAWQQFTNQDSNASYEDPATTSWVNHSFDCSRYDILYCDQSPAPIPPTVGDGDGLLGHYYSDMDLTNQAFERVDAKIDFNWVTGTPDNVLGNDSFSVAWSGEILAPYSETFTFYTGSDDGNRLWIDDQLVVDDWSNHGYREKTGTFTMVAGQKYDIRFEFFENTGNARATLAWSSTRQSKEIIPQSYLYSDSPSSPPPPIVVEGDGDGLLGHYYSDMELTNQAFERVDAKVDFNWFAGTPDNVLGNDIFSVAWSGEILAPYSETFTFYTGSDDGNRLWIDDQLIVDDWSNHGYREKTGTFTMVAGQKYDIRFEFFENTGNARATLAWSSENQSKEIIPQAYLYADPPSSTPPAIGSGDGLLGHYYSDMDLTNQAFERVDAKVDFNWFVGTPDNVLGNDIFSVEWSGEIQAPYSETFTFYTGSDDGNRLWIDNQLIVDDWSNHSYREKTGTFTMVAGQKYDIRFQFFENTGNARATLAWSSESQSKEIIPQAYLYADSPSNPPPPSPPTVEGDGDGLLGQYYSDKDFNNQVFERVDDNVSFTWHGGVGGGMPNDNFAVRWTGSLMAQYTETYQIYTMSDDGIRMWIDNQLVVDDWNDHSLIQNSYSMPMVAGQIYDIRIEYYDHTYSGIVKLEWSSPSTSRQTIPQSYLYASSSSNSLASQQVAMSALPETDDSNLRSGSTDSELTEELSDEISSEISSTEIVEDPTIETLALDEEDPNASVEGNQPPRIVTIDSQLTDINTAVELQVQASDLESTELNYLAVGLPPGLSIHFDTGVISGVPTEANVYQVNVTVLDGGNLSDVASFAWTIAEAGGELVQEVIEEPVVEESVIEPVKEPAEDPIVEEPVVELIEDPAPDTALSLVEEPVQEVIEEAVVEPVQEVIEEPAQEEVEDPIVEEPVVELVKEPVVEDDSEETVEIVEVIEPVNQAPAITHIGTQLATLNESVNLQVGAHDPEGSVLSFNATGLPTGLMIDFLGGVITGAPTVSGHYQVYITVFDDQSLSSTLSFLWTVQDPNAPEVVVTTAEDNVVVVEEINQAPVLINPNTQSSKVGTQVTLQIQAADPEQSTLTYNITGLPTGLSIDPANGLITGTPTVAGNYQPEVSVADVEGLSISTSFEWLVNEPIVAVEEPASETEPVVVVVEEPASETEPVVVVVEEPASETEPVVVVVEEPASETEPVVVVVESNDDTNAVEQPSLPSITSVVLIDAEADTDIMPLTDDAIIDLNTLPTSLLNIRVDVSDVVGSVKFDVNEGEITRTEKQAPYSLIGDTDGDYDTWRPDSTSYMLTVTLYQDADGQEQLGEPLTLSFTITE